MLDDGIDQLRQLNETPVPEDALGRGRIELMAYMVSNPRPKSQSRFSWLGQGFVWKPMTVSVLVAGTVLCGAGGAVYASGSALPGGRLYSVKMLTEEIRTRLALSSDSRFQLTAERADDRLSEAERLMQKPCVGAAVVARRQHLQETMQRYQDNLSALNTLAAKFEKSQNPTAKVAFAAQTVERVLEHHATLVDSTSTTADAKTKETFMNPITHTLELQAHMLNALSVQEQLEIRIQNRADTLRERLRTFEAKQHSAANTPAPTDEQEDEETDTPTLIPSDSASATLTVAGFGTTVQAAAVMVR